MTSDISLSTSTCPEKTTPRKHSSPTSPTLSPLSYSPRSAALATVAPWKRRHSNSYSLYSELVLSYHYSPVIVHQTCAASADLPAQDRLSDVRQFVIYYFGQYGHYRLTNCLCFEVFCYFACFVDILVDDGVEEVQYFVLRVSDGCIVLDVWILGEIWERGVECDWVEYVCVELSW